MTATPNRPTRPQGDDLAAEQAAILDASLEAYPAGFSRPDLVARFGDTAVSRIGELRDLGWDYPRGEMRDGHAYYRLRSPTRGTPNSLVLGVKAASRSVSGLDVGLYAESRGVLSPEVEEALLAEISAAMRKALSTLAPAEVPGTYDPPSTEVGAILDLFARLQEPA